MLILKSNSFGLGSSIAVSVLLVELGMTVFPFSMAGPSFLQSNWMVIHYKPLNDGGYRDHSFPVEGKRQVVFIGDSFTSGLGLTNIDDRFDRVSNAYGSSNFAAVNLGIPGSGASKQLQALKQYPVIPERVVYQYYINDIDETVMNSASRDIRPVDEDFLELISSPWISFSYIVNTVFWSVPNPWLEINFDRYLKEAWNNPQLLRQHEKELQAIIDHCVVHDIQLHTIVFPKMDDIELYGEETAHVVAFFKSKGVPVIDVSDLVKGLSLESRVVNAKDPHPSKTVHEIVGRELGKLFSEE
jgi:hypothetical protein